MPINQRRPDTPLASSPEARFSVSQDSIKPGKKTWQQMSAVEKGAKKTQLMKEGGIERFKTYKDSISADANKRVNEAFEKNAATRGMTVEELSKQNEKDRRKANRNDGGLNNARHRKSNGPKSPCKGGICPWLNNG